MAELRISTEKVCFIIARARAFHVKTTPVLDDYGSNPSDEEALHPILEDRLGDASETEFKDAVAALDGAELADLIALSWLGGDESRDADDWDDVLAEVADQRPEHPVDAMTEQPLLAEMLEEGLAKFGLSCAESGEAIPPDAKLLPD
jgi:hypothetical protein